MELETYFYEVFVFLTSREEILCDGRYPLFTFILELYGTKLIYIGLLSESTETHRTLKKRIQKDKMDLTKFKSNKIDTWWSHDEKIPIHQMLIENNSSCRRHLKKRLFDENILEYILNVSPFRAQSKKDWALIV